MTNSRIGEVLERYEVALTALEEATLANDGMVETDGERQRRQRKQWKKLLPKVRKIIGFPPKRDTLAYHIPPSNILDVLKARDAVQEVLEDKTQDSSEKLINIIRLDRRLKKQAKSIFRAVNLDDWRASFNPSPQSWWWFLDQKFGLWSSLLSIMCLVLSLSLIGDIAPRFLSGGSEFWGNFVVILQGILVLITGSSIFSKTAGRKLTNVFSSGLWNKWGTHLALLSLALLLLLHQSLPQIAVSYRERGLSNYEAGHLAKAQSNYQRALALNPNDEKIHLYLGSLYDSLQDFERARTEYQIAMRTDSAAAFNNMARLYLLDENNATAASLLMQSKAQITSEDDMTLRYSLHKNLGWVNLKQKRLAEAENELLTAIEDIAEPAQLSEQRQVSAYCLLAQVLDAKGDTEQARLKWEYCFRHASPLIPEEAAWLEIAQERLTSE